MPEVNIIVRAKDEATRVLKGINNSLFGFNDTLLKVGVIAAPIIGGVGMAIGKLAYDAAQAEPVRLTFQNLTEDIGTTADAMLDELRPATMNVLSDLDLMKSTNKLMAMSLASSTEEATKLSEMAVVLGTAMGVDATTALENFTLMLANQSIPRLDTFGISSGKVRERIEELQKQFPEMSRETAFMTATMEEGEIAMGRVGDVSDTGAIKIAEFRAKMANFKDTVGEALMPILIELLDDALIPLADKLLEMSPIITEQIGPAVEGLIGVFERLGGAIRGVLDFLEELDKWTAEHWAPPEMRGWAGRAAVGQATAASPQYGGWAGRANINVYGLPGLEDAVRDIVNQEGGRTLGEP